MSNLHRFLTSSLFFPACFLTIALHQRNAEAQSQRVGLQLSIVDEQDMPVPQARVVLSCPMSSWVPYETKFVTCGVLGYGTTNPLGQHAFSYSIDDPRLISQVSEFMVLVDSEQLAPAMAMVSPSRLLCDAPLQIKLGKKESLSVNIVDSGDKPLHGARVSPATIAGQLVPFEIAQRFSTMTDEQGIARCACQAPSLIDSVYVTMEGLPHQCVPIQWNDGIASAKLYATRERTGKLVLAESSNLNFPNSNSAPLSFDHISLRLVTTVSAKAGFVWSETHVSKDGTFVLQQPLSGTCLISGALPQELPFAIDSEKGSKAFESNVEQLQLVLERATRYQGQVVDNQSGNGIKGIFIDCFDWFDRPTVSDAEGRFHFFHTSNVNYYAADIFGRYTQPSGFYARPESTPVDGMVELKKQVLIPMTSSTGKVVNKSGEPLPGIEIVSNWKTDRFNTINSQYSNRDGTFRLYGVGNNTTATMSAKTETSGTRSATNILISDDVQLELKIEDLPSAKFRGRAVDETGTPLPNSFVQFFEAKIFAEESYGGEDRTASPIKHARPTLTKNDGTFESPNTTNFDKDVSIRVSSPGYIARRFPWQKRKPDAQSVVDLGLFTLRKLPDIKAIRFEFFDAASHLPIENLRFAVLCGDEPIRRSTLSNESTKEYLLENKPYILAAHADGYAPFVKTVQKLGPIMKISLSKKGKAAIPSRQPSRAKSSDYQRAAQSLLQLVKEPDNSATMFRKHMYYGSLGFADPALFVNRIETFMKAGIDKELIGVLIGKMADGESTRRLVQLLSEQGKCHLLVRLADQVNTDSEREELISEATITARRLSGESQLYSIVDIANCMMKFGMMEEARDLLKNAWEDHKELGKVLSVGKRELERSPLRGVARFFAPAYAIIDPDAALKLIEYTAYANEIDWLKALAIGYMANADIKGWQSKLGLLTNNSSAGRGVFDACERVPFHDVARAKMLAQAMPVSVDRAKFMMHVAADNQQNSKARSELVEMAISDLRNEKRFQSWESAGRIAAMAAATVMSWDPAMAEEFLFEAIWQNTNGNSWLPHSTQCDLAKELSRVDAEIALAILHPCLRDWSWLYSERDMSLVYRLAPPLIALANIDPQQALMKAKELMETDLQDRTSNQLSLVNGLISEWRELDYQQKVSTHR